MQKYYAAIDLHSNNGVLTVIDGNDKVLRQRKLPNRIDGFVHELEPFREALQGVAVESTFNWYWLVDGLLANGYRAMLVNTSAIQQYEGLKHSDDKYDGWWLAHMMRLGILPTGYIYPGEQRAVRDLLRKRSTLVQQRTANILSVQNLEQRNRGTKITSEEVKKLTAAQVHELYANDDLALSITSTLGIINALSEQIKLLEKVVLKRARLRDEFELLGTVWGIGRILSLVIMYEASGAKPAEPPTAALILMGGWCGSQPIRRRTIETTGPPTSDVTPRRHQTAAAKRRMGFARPY